MNKKKRGRKFYSFATKLEAVNMYYSGFGSSTISKHLSIEKTGTARWVQAYKNYGEEGLVATK